MTEIHAITGAFGYSGRYIAAELLQRGVQVITLTGHPDRPNPFGERVKAYPFHFEQPGKLTEALRGVHTLYNTYWVRFNYGETTFEKAVANTKILFDAAKAAGVKRIVHVSITNPSLNSPLPYFSGKAELERYLKNLGVPYAILRPNVIFGREDILINNIAFMLRRFPVFGIPGAGDYKLQPIFVEDMAKLAADAGAGTENVIVDAIGPETFTFEELVQMLAAGLGVRPMMVHIPPFVMLGLARLIGLFVKDVVLTPNEIRGLMDNLLVTDSPPAGRTKLSAWAQANLKTLGKDYASELKKHYVLTG